MEYFICQDWQNTRGNHAGMVYLCQQIKREHSQEAKIYVLPNIRVFDKNIYILQNIIYICFSIFLFIKIKKKDKLFLMEYLLPTHNQFFIARPIFHLKKCKIIGLIHLVPSDLDKFFLHNNNLIRWINSTDKIITLGSSLTQYLIDRGISKNKIHTSFHYVENKYYSNKNQSIHKPINAIIMGSMKRDFKTIINIINKTPEVHFIVCKKDIYKYTQLLYQDNYELHGFIDENKLRHLMSISDISLNVMFDTIGSNVITTSLAMGLAMVVSDVGSIKDYCQSSNSIFCSTEDDFVNALHKLSFNTQLLKSMKDESIKISNKLSIKEFYSDIKYI